MPRLHLFLRSRQLVIIPFALVSMFIFILNTHEATAYNECNIKGNISFNGGEKIYHFPGCENYNQTRINTNYGERWFCSESEAQAAGWRRAYNCPSGYRTNATPSGDNSESINQSVICPKNSHKSYDTCICDDGYISDGGECKEEDSKEINFMYYNTDKDKHCELNRPGTVYFSETDECLCPGGEYPSKNGVCPIPEYEPTARDMLLINALEEQIELMDNDKKNDVFRRANSIRGKYSRSSRAWYIINSILIIIKPESDGQPSIQDLIHHDIFIGDSN